MTAPAPAPAPARAAARAAVEAAASELNRQLAGHEQLSAADDQPLTGDNAQLDSLGFVNFLATVERHAATAGLRVDLIGPLSAVDAERITVADVVARLEAAAGDRG